MRRSLLVIALGSLFGMGAPALAGTALQVPDARHSTVPAVLLACPRGDAVYAVVVHDGSDMPIAGSEVVLDFSGCGGPFIHCPGTPATFQYLDPAPRARAYTQPSGLAQFPLTTTGASCPNTHVIVYADGVVLGQATYVSPDQDGDGDVDATDDHILSTRIGTSNPASDLDGDGSVTTTDERILGDHSGHVCDVAVPNRRSRWGELELRYR